MEVSEMFLLGWAITATILAVIYKEVSRRANNRLVSTSVLLAEVVMGDVKPINKGDVWTVENEYTRLSFKKKGE
jgi:hypothetical protein